ncbi:MAG TPA: GNVR domain-containing protein [Vicinamibacterales bacterium]|nr:GNVR domain-containing protein [Vicinamibacterales bacterium]
MIPGKQYSFDTVMQVARRRKWLIILPTLLLGAIGFGIVAYLPNVYRSETLILVVPQRVPESYVRSTITARIEDRLQSISQQILSRTRLEQIVTDFNLYAKERADKELMEDIVERMRTRDIGIDIIKGDAFRVSYQANDPRTAMRVTERLASLFIDESLRDREVLAEGTSQFLSTQLDEARRQLVLTENKLQEYQRAHNGELPAQMAANLQGQHNAEMALQSLGEDLNRDRERRLLLERQVTDIIDAPVETKPADPEKPEMSQTLEDELRLAQQALLAVELKLKPEHPDVRKQRRAVEELEKRVAAQKLEGTLTAKPAVGTAVVMDAAKRKRLTDARADLENLDRQLQAKIAEESRLRGMVGMYQARIEATPVREAELAALARDYETQQQSYRGLLQKKEESQISANLEKRQIGEQFKVLDPARMPEKPASPDRPRLYLIAALVAIALGLGCAALAEFFDKSLRTEADVRAALNLMVLATVPTIRDASRSPRRWGRAAAASGAALTLIVVGATVAWRLLK